MSAGNSADKPQFVENQMLTHDSLNNLVEFSAGRTQRVMKALGLGGTVSGVSWRFENNQIIIEPGFIVFPDGEVAEIKKTLTFSAINTNGYLGNDPLSSAISSSPGQLQVAYQWAKDNHSNGCFMAEANPQKMVLDWSPLSVSQSQNNAINTAILFRPMSFTLNALVGIDGVKMPFFLGKINEQIDEYNKLVVRARRLSGFGNMAELTRVNEELDFFDGCGILGDISFEIAFIARRLWLAFRSLVERDYSGSTAERSIVLNRGLNTGKLLNSVTTGSLLFEIALWDKVASESIDKNITVVNKGNVPDVSPEGVCAFLGSTCISGVFLNNTIRVLRAYCDCETTAPAEEFFYHPGASWGNPGDFRLYASVQHKFVLNEIKWSKEDFDELTGGGGQGTARSKESIAQGSFDLVQHRCISSYQHKSGVPWLLANSNLNNRAGFLKPSREW